MTFKLSQKSEGLLELTPPSLRRVVRRAIGLSKVDFKVAETLRSLDQQKKNIVNGVSWTLDSKHLMHADGFAHAVDLWALSGAQVTWAWPPYFQIAKAMQEASRLEKVPLVWGAAWDRELVLLGTDLEEAVAAYIRRRKALDKEAKLDGPHFQLA